MARRKITKEFVDFYDFIYYEEEALAVAKEKRGPRRDQTLMEYGTLADKDGKLIGVTKEEVQAYIESLQNS